MASVLDQGAVLVAPALPGPPPLKSKQHQQRKGRNGKEGKTNSSSAVIASSLFQVGAGRGGPGHACCSLGPAEADRALARSPRPPRSSSRSAFSPPRSSASSSSSSSSSLPGPPPCVALLGGKGSDCSLITVGARLAPVLAEEFVKAVAAGEGEGGGGGRGRLVNGADEERGTAATATRRKSRRAAAGGFDHDGHRRSVSRPSRSAGVAGQATITATGTAALPPGKAPRPPRHSPPRPSATRATPPSAPATSPRPSPTTPPLPRPTPPARWR